MQCVAFQSKYMDIFPLYQDYSLEGVRDDLHRLKVTFETDWINPEHLQSLHVPPSFCRSFVAASAQPRSTRSPPFQPFSVTPSTLWQDLNEVKASGLLSSLTAREIRLQESMFELIGSEASYLKSLGVVVNHFYASKTLKRTLSKMEHHVLFSNICHVKAASERFLMDLEAQLGRCVLIPEVGDIVLQHRGDFQRLYVPYVINMMYQESLIGQLLEQNRDFLHTLNKLEAESVCQRQTLKSFLVLPFQRITRVKLLLETILKLTEPDSDAASNLKKAIGAIHAIVTECDDGVKKMKQTEELICLEMLLDFSDVKVLFTSNNSYGLIHTEPAKSLKFKCCIFIQAVPLVRSTRSLILQGPLRQLTVESTGGLRMSLNSIYLHLFNDLLIVSLKKDQGFKVVDYAPFPTHVTVEYLQTEVLGLPADSFLLHLSQSQTGRATAMILVALTSSDKELWMKALSSKE
ncbi:rho guanine nucleotide exchange factor 19 [Cololabis saira]|uniref:rho guanine nucleotide exchange factor 19 n=1 Tax=Cololabis saira TaxID=129043 RepID=UPI002AD3773A|nr:rho guanine nucleotide exchange factor 19 [Cololabis saira]